LDSSTSVFSGTRIRPCEKSIPAPPDTKKSVVRLHYFFKRAAVLSAEYQGLVIAKGETDKTDRIFAVLIESMNKVNGMRKESENPLQS